MPPLDADYAQWNVPKRLQDDIGVGNGTIFGRNAEGLKMEQFRICW